MESLLEKIYDGKEIIINKNLDSDEYKKASAEYMESHQTFMSALSAEQHNKLDELIENHDKLWNILGKHYFQQGFQIGVRLFLEVFPENSK